MGINQFIYPDYETTVTAVPALPGVKFTAKTIIKFDATYADISQFPCWIDCDATDVQASDPAGSYALLKSKGYSLLVGNRVGVNFKMDQSAVELGTITGGVECPTSLQHLM